MSVQAIVDNKDLIVALHMRQQLMALALEIKGMKHSSGRSICQFIRDQYNINCRKKKDVYRIFHSIIIKAENEAGIEPRPLNQTEKELLGEE